MLKPPVDQSHPETTYEVPKNILAEVTVIEMRAKQTYPDHGESREKMVRQELLKALSERTEALQQTKAEKVEELEVQLRNVIAQRDKLMALCDKAAVVTLALHQALQFPLGD